MPNVCKHPNSIQECSLNVETALNILRENPEGLPYDLLWKKENILKGDGSVIYPLFLSLKERYDLTLHGMNLSKMEVNPEDQRDLVNSST